MINHVGSNCIPLQEKREFMHALSCIMNACNERHNRNGSGEGDGAAIAALGTAQQSGSTPFTTVYCS